MTMPTSANPPTIWRAQAAQKSGTMSAEVVHVVAELLQMGHHCQLEHVAGVVVGDRDLHSSHF